MPGLRVSKLSSSDIDNIRAFTQACELLLDRPHFSMGSAYEAWEELDDDDEDKILILKIRKSIAINEDMSEEDIDGRILAYEFLKRKYTHRLQLATLTVDVLIDNCCDPMVDHLEFHPSLQMVHVEAEQ